MSMLAQTKEVLEQVNAFEGKQNSHLKSVINGINFPTISERMKAVVAVAQITAFASQFRRNLKLWDSSTEVPINAISFVITGSGSGKDSSVKAARKCFKEGYNKVVQAVNQKAIDMAIEAAKEENAPNPTDEAVYKEYLKPVPPIDIMPTTGPGLVQHINDIGEIELGAGFMYSGEFSDELAFSQDMVDNIKILSEIYDTGDKEVKYTKSVEARSKAINGQPVSALFVGSPGHILYDEATKKKFNVAFMSKLARRSWFCYAPDKIDRPDFDSIDELLDWEENIEKQGIKARAGINAESGLIADYHLPKQGELIEIHPDVQKLFKVYKRYNDDLADLLPSQESTYVLIRRHLQWKALKLAGAFTIMKREDEISLDSYVEAIRFCETLDKDMEMFEKDLNKSPHELLVDFFHTRTLVNGAADISTHDLKKQGFMVNIGMPKLREMVNLCAGYDRDSVYSIINDGLGITYAPIMKTEVINVTYKDIDNSELNSAIASGDAAKIRQAKHNIGLTINDGFTNADTEFDKLPEMLQQDYAYSPFRFTDGIRKKSNLEPATKWLVLDIDDSPLDAEEAHFMLSDLNHHIAMTSDNDNRFKYRVLLELDSEVTLNAIEWKHFYSKIAEDIGLNVDALPQSQIFYSYAGRDIYSNIEADPIETRDYVMFAKDKASNPDQLKLVSDKQKQALLNDELVTFEYAFEAPYGSGSRNIYRMIRHAQDLGASLEHVIRLIDDVNEYWESPMPDERIDKLKEQAERLY